MESEDWKSPEDRALWLLSHADQAEPREPLRGMALQLRLWRYRRSGLHVSWSIILPVREYRGRKAVIREVAWDRSQRQALIRVRDAELEAEDLSPHLERIGGMHPMGEPVPAGKGDRTGIEGTRSFAHVRWEWSGRGPLWFGRLRALLVGALD